MAVSVDFQQEMMVMVMMMGVACFQQRMTVVAGLQNEMLTVATLL